MFVEVRFDVGCGSHVNAERLVISAYNYTLGAEVNIFQKDTRLLVVRPVKGRIGVAFAFHLMILINIPHRAHL